MAIKFSYFPQNRLEHLIVTARIGLASFSLLMIWFEPFEPGKYINSGNGLMAIYMVYATVLAILVWTHKFPLNPSFPLITHAIDFITFSLFICMTRHPATPFLAYFIFSIVCAGARWQWRGSLLTGGVGLAAFFGLKIYLGHELVLDQFIILSVYLALVAALLGYMGTYHVRRRDQIFMLAAWPHSVLLEANDLVRDALEHARSILDFPRVLMVWEESEEPWLHLAVLSLSEFNWTRESPTRFLPVVAEPLSDDDFFCLECLHSDAAVFRRSSGGLQRYLGAPLHPDLQARFGIETVLSLKFSGETIKGRLFFLDKQSLSSGDLILGQIVVREVVGRVDLFYLIQQLKRMTAAESRLRVAYDLHDGLLQSLAAVTMKLDIICHLLNGDPSKIRDRLLEIDRMLHDEQENLRCLIGELRPVFDGGHVGSREAGLITRLESLRNQIERQWGLCVNLAIAGVDWQMHPAVAQDIYYIIREAVLNSARHAAASSVDVKLWVEDDQVRITVADNGHGFSFRGHYDHVKLTEKNLGPVTLKGRIMFLKGSLDIDSSEAGARLEIALPFLGPGA
jgi:signal transduction histidine kinase